MPNIRLRKITEEDIENLPAFPDERDTIGKEYRLDLHREIEAKFARNRDTGGDPGFSCQLVSGPKEVGKTNLMSLFCIPYRQAGFEIISNLSLLFGWHIEGAVDIFAFSKVLPGRCILVLDEIQALLSRYRQGNTGQMEFVGGIAGLRKQRIHLLGGTSQEPEVANNFLRECDWIYYPARRKRYPQMGQGQKHYPEWCHLRIEAVGPHPLRGKTVGEAYGIGVNRTRAKRKTVRGITPANIYEAAALQFSFAALPQGKAAGQHIMAKDMRSALNEIDVIDFDTEDVDGAESNAAASQDWQATIDADKKIIAEFYKALRYASVEITGKRGLPFLLTRVALAGFNIDEAAIAETLSRWVDYRPGGTVDLDTLATYFTS